MILKEYGKGSLYHYFKSKKTMVLAVVKECLAPRMDEFYKIGVEMKIIFLMVLVLLSLVFSACAEKNNYNASEYNRANNASQKALERLDKE